MNYWPAIRARVSQSCAWLDHTPLRYWGFHVCVSAAPSFAFGFALEPKPQRVMGMVLGVGFFIALYTFAARWTFPNQNALPLWRRAIRLGTLIRTVWATLALDDSSEKRRHNSAHAANPKAC